MLGNSIFHLLLVTVAMLWSMAESTSTAVNPDEDVGCLPKLQEANINPPLDARDCSDYFNFGRRESGVYAIRPKGVKDSFLVFCEMEKDGGGWTVIQRRGNYGFPDDYFQKNWTEYKQGFGILDLEFWLGNDKISAISKQGKYQLKVDLMDVDWKLYNYTYGIFKVEDELELYKLSIGEYSVHSSEDILLEYNGMRFTTLDRDNDDWAVANCASVKQGAWWYKACGHSMLNGMKSSEKEKSLFYITTPNRMELRYSQLMIRK